MFRVYIVCNIVFHIVDLIQVNVFGWQPFDSFRDKLILFAIYSVAATLVTYGIGKLVLGPNGKIRGVR